MPDFSNFDTRGYRTVDVAHGLREWVGDLRASRSRTPMDIDLLDSLIERGVALRTPRCRPGLWHRADGVVAAWEVGVRSDRRRRPDPGDARRVGAISRRVRPPRRGRRGLQQDYPRTRVRPRRHVPGRRASSRPAPALCRRRPAFGVPPGAAYVLVGFPPSLHHGRPACRRISTMRLGRADRDRDARPPAQRARHAPGIAAGWTLVEMKERAHRRRLAGAEAEVGVPARTADRVRLRVAAWNSVSPWP